MIRPTPKEIRAVLTVLDKARFTALVRVVMQLRNPEQCTQWLDGYQQARMYLYEWLTHLGFLSDAQVERLMARCEADMFRDSGRALAAYEQWPDCGWPEPFLFTVSDRRWCMWSGTRRWYDVQEDDTIDTLPCRAVSHFTCDVMALLDQKQRWLRKLYPEGADAGAEHPVDPAGGGTEAVRPGGGPQAADERGDVRHDAPGAGL